MQLGPVCLDVLDCSVGAVLENKGAVSSLECAFLTLGLSPLYGDIRGVRPLKTGGQVLVSNDILLSILQVSATQSWPSARQYCAVRDDVPFRLVLTTAMSNPPTWQPVQVGLPPVDLLKNT